MPLEFILTKARIDYHSVIVADFFQEWGLLLGEVLKKRKERRKKKVERRTAIFTLWVDWTKKKSKEIEQCKIEGRKNKEGVEEEEERVVW